MKAFEIKNDIYWVGGIDWTLRDFHGYLTQRGSTYNAYLIVDEKIVLVDTVKHYLCEEMLDRIGSVTDPSKIDYIVSNHVEMDHSGSLPRLMEICRNATVIASPNGEIGLKKHFTADWNFKVVKTGDSINIGKRNLNFVLTQMVHWPDSMVTYIPEDKLLLSNDSFGQHIASPERFDDELGWENIRDEAAKYYANIVLPYGMQVGKALNAVSGLEIDMIAPSHGLIWRKNINNICELYKKWSGNVTEDKAIIVYDAMWGSTETIARIIYEVFEEKGIKAYLFDLKKNHSSDIMTHILTAKYICVGSPTLNNGMLPSVSAFLTYLKGLAPKNRIALAFGSYGWGGQSISQINDILAGCSFDMLEFIKAQYIPDIIEIKELTRRILGGIV
ncbi:MAG: FprA family A-type flavoprotein [Candidatus Theseobacter exili]|nr:FprA family A-type flavoprotein [Candidatus Theseobacter exili]